jgi:integrase/recombinase XerD
MGRKKLCHIPEAERIWRENRGLSDRAIVNYRHFVRHFLDYCRSNGLSDKAELTLTGTRRFALWYARRHKVKFCYAFPQARSALRTWAYARRILGENLPDWLPAREDPQLKLPPLVREFQQHTRRHRGNSPGTLLAKTRYVTRFLAFLATRRRRVSELRLSDIDAFIVHLSPEYSHSLVCNCCSSLRSFTRFLYASGRLSVDLAPSIVSPRIAFAERPRRTLPWEYVQRILRAIDPTARGGSRDYAMLLMMTMYGLGAGEITQLKLEDVDWYAGTLHVVRPKTGVEFQLPLLPPVARALANYLLHGRPRHVNTRHLFVASHVPHKGLSGAAAVSHILHKHAFNAGISVRPLATHMLRHTHATRQMELGANQKVVSDILGHRDPRSTSVYIRVAVERLRGLALRVPQ